ncbi:hypothetical protein ACGFY9_15710 [Streptomyces sp. NPDC048504]|uniref:hypothetical protein n=1 Tax=Streptomyces sp. NPDC048504 TaxID=3365559 RepID=UPI00371C2832
MGRTALLQAVEEQLGAQDTAAVLPHALHGMGGVGKSQLALEYVYRHQRDYKVICWIPAERDSLILTALAGLASRLRVIPESMDGGQETVARCAGRFGENHGHALLTKANLAATLRAWGNSRPPRNARTTRPRGWPRQSGPTM